MRTTSRFNKILSPLFCLSLAVLTGCNGVGTAKIDGANVGTTGTNTGDTGGGASFSFSGLVSVSSKTDSTISLHWTAHADAVAYDIFNMSSGSYVWLSTVSGQSSSSGNLTGLTPGATYKFRVRAKNSSGENDSNAVDLTVTMDTAPARPSGVSRTAPTSSPSASATPTIRVSGVKSGDTIKVYSNSSCTTEVGSAVASGTTIDIVTNTLTAGSYTFYAAAINSAGTASPCSTASASYTKTSCPNGYIAVPSNSGLGTTADFCVSKYEMRCAGTSCPTPTPGANAVAAALSTGLPWTHINQTNAKTACQNLNAINGVSNKYDLISNAEWMTLARDVELEDSNWSSGTPGTGSINRGHTDSSPLSVMTAAADSDPYNGTGNNATQGIGSGWEQKRTHTLSNGEVVWDLAGNAWEWIDWAIAFTDKAYWAVDGDPVSIWRDFSQLNRRVGPTDVMKTETWIPYFYTASSSQGIGQYFGGNHSDGGAFMRGGSYEEGVAGGVYTVSLYSNSSNAGPSVSFRCVYRP